MMHQVGSRLDHGYRVTSQVKLGELPGAAGWRQSSAVKGVSRRGEGRIERDGTGGEMKRLEEGERVGRGRGRGGEEGREGRAGSEGRRNGRPELRYGSRK